MVVNMKLIGVLLMILSFIFCFTNAHASYWPVDAKNKYINRCSNSISAQGASITKAKNFCTCITNGMEKEFGASEYNQMMKATANPNGSKYDRRLYDVFMACQNSL